MSVPIFSIVIANFNYGRFLEAAIQSVLKQNCQDFELIVVDGGSTDNSLDIIMKYQARLAWWCSEKDRGQSHAFNKGFSHANGKFFTWLNADDLLMPGTLNAARRKLERHPDAQWLTGNFFRFDSRDRVLECKWGPWTMPGVFQGPHAPIAVFGPTSFFSKELYMDVGGFDETFHYAMDTDLWMRFMSRGVLYLRLNYYCWGFRMHEASKTAEYTAHSLSQLEKNKLNLEVSWSINKCKYNLSPLKRIEQIVWRVLTCSEFKSVYMKMRWRGKRMSSFISSNCRA